MKMKEIIKKYEAKLEFLNKVVEQTKDLMDEDTLEMMSDIKSLLTEVIIDFNEVKEDPLKSFINKGYVINIYSKGNDGIDWYFLIKKGTIDTNDEIYKSYEEAEAACLVKLNEITKYI